MSFKKCIFSKEFMFQNAYFSTIGHSIKWEAPMCLISGRMVNLLHTFMACLGRSYKSEVDTYVLLWKALNFIS